MPSVQQLKNIYQKYHGRPFTEADLAALGGEARVKGIPETKFITETVLPSSEYQQRGQRLLAGQKAEKEGLFKQFEGIRAGQEKLPAAYNRLTAKAGVPQLQEQLGALRGQVFTVRDLIDRLEEDIGARTEGTLTTEAQRRRQLAAEGDPLRTQLGRLATGQAVAAEQLGEAYGQVGTQLGLLSTQQNRELEATKMRIDATSDRFAREFTNYTTEKQQNLDFLMKKIEREQELSDREWAMAQQLAAEEREWERTKEQLQIKQEMQEGLISQTVDLGDRVQYLDFRGNVIREVAKGKLSGTGTPAFADLLGGGNIEDWMKQFGIGATTAQAAGGVDYNQQAENIFDEIAAQETTGGSGGFNFGDWLSKNIRLREDVKKPSMEWLYNKNILSREPVQRRSIFVGR